MRTELVPVEGGLLEVRVEPADDPSGKSMPPLVFLHEGLGSVELWRSFPVDLRAASGGPATLVYSRHGHGRSDRAALPRPTSYMHHEADVVLPQVLAHFGIEAPVLVGHSDGASIALLYAGAGHPVSALVLMAPHVFVEDLTVHSISTMHEEAADGALLDRMARYHDDAAATFKGWLDVWLSSEFRSWNIEERLASIDRPILLIQGDADPYGTTAQLDAIERQVGGPTRRLMLSGVKHGPHLERPEETLTAAAAFIRELNDGQLRARSSRAEGVRG